MSPDEVPPLIDEAEVVVVGAGPAGSACAARAAERGLGVILIDQGSFPRDKACGDGLTRSSVAFLHQLGLDAILDQSYEIEGARLVTSHRKTRAKKYMERPDRPRWARCVSRRVLDHALLDAALERGAQFIKGRVDAPFLVNGDISGVELQTDRGRARVGAQIVVAADGATSRIRRKCALGATHHMTASAIRQYVTTEQELDPLFEVHVPVVSDGEILFGYGWVFPLGARYANVGIGVARVTGLEHPPSLRQILDEFFEDLQMRRDAPYGAMERLGDPSGAPLAIDFSSDRCQFDNVLFTGDAARTVDPITGEGISYALHAGEMVADLAYGGLRKNRGIDQAGLQLARRFPRLGQDLAPVARRTVQKLRDRVSSDGEATVKLDVSANESLLKTAMHMAVTPKSDSQLGETPIMRFLEDQQPALASRLSGLNDIMLDTVNTDFPLVSELLHRRFRAGLGPMLAATLLLTNAASNGFPSDSTINAALACELTRLAHLTLSEVGRETQSTLGHSNAALAILLGDFCITRSIDLATSTNNSIVASLAAVNRRLSVGGLLQIRDLFDLGRTPRRYFEVTANTAGALFGLSTSLGAELAGARQADIDALKDYGHAFGVAVQIASDIMDLTTRDDVVGTPEGSSLRAGIYTLPVIYGLSAGSSLRRCLSPSPEAVSLPAALAAVRDSGGIDRACTVCRDRIAEAQHALAGTANVERGLLEDLAGFVVDQLPGPDSLMPTPSWSPNGNQAHAHGAQLTDLLGHDPL